MVETSKHYVSINRETLPYWLVYRTEFDIEKGYENWCSEEQRKACDEEGLCKKWLPIWIEESGIVGGEAGAREDYLKCKEYIVLRKEDFVKLAHKKQE